MGEAKWPPETRDDYIETLADGFERFTTRREEAEAKRKSAEGDGKKEGEEDKTGDQKLTIGERLLGIKPG